MLFINEKHIYCMSSGHDGQLMVGKVSESAYIMRSFNNFVGTGICNFEAHIPHLSIDVYLLVCLFSNYEIQITTSQISNETIKT